MKRFIGHLFVLLFVIYNVNCYLFDKAIECEKHGVYSADPTNCADYYLCFQGRMLRFRCQWGLHWNEKLSKCDTPGNAKCAGSADTPPPLPDTPPPLPDTPPPTSQLKAGNKCPQDGEYFPEPTDCSSYYLCYDGVLRKHRCLWGLNWNQRAKKCDPTEECDETNQTPRPPIVDPVVEPKPTPAPTPKPTAKPTAKPTLKPTPKPTPPPTQTTDAPVDAKKEKLKVICYCE